MKLIKITFRLLISKTEVATITIVKMRIITITESAVECETITILSTRKAVTLYP